jgi:hypothetical protein
MKIRLGAAALLAALALTACSSSTNGKGGVFNGGPISPVVTAPGTTGQQSGTDVSTPPSTSLTSDDTGSGSGSSPSAFCTKLEQAETTLGTIGTSLSDPSKAKDVLNEEAAVFNNLAKDAPSDIAPAIRDLATVISAAANYYANPGSGSTGALRDLTTKLPEDIQKLSTYAATNC